MIDLLKIHALADGELSAEELSELQAQVAACEKSSAELQAIKDLKGLAKRLEPIPCEQTWSACLKRLNEIDRTRRIEAVVGRYAWGFCGVFLLAIGIGGYMTRIGAAGVVRSGDVPAMVSGMTPFAASKGDSGDAARKWFDENVIPDQGMRILSGRAGIADGHEVDELKLRDSYGDLALIVIHGVDQIDGLQQAGGQYRQGMIDDMNCVSWSAKDCALLLVGDRNADDLRAIAAKISVH